MARSLLRVLAPAVALSAGVSLRADPPSPHPGADVYAKRCAKCHGTEGQGVADEYEAPLQGDLSVGSLARLIAKTMPEDEEKKCSAAEAKGIAEYIHGAFYSPAARRAKGLIPEPRVELTRLTAAQHRNAIADLIGRFTPPPDRTGWLEPEERGLRAEYYASEGMTKTAKKILSRTDPSVDFDFGENAPVEGLPAEQFAVVWEGSLLAEDTGDHEFRLRTANGARLYLNTDPSRKRGGLRDDGEDGSRPAFIDEWVGSGSVRERTARAFLLGGRRYPIRIEFFKYKDKTASVRLEWNPPHGVWSVPGPAHLAAAPSPRTFVVDTPFPADDRSLGYERGSSVSAEWHAAAVEAALAAADEVGDRLPLLAGAAEKDPGRAGRLRGFCERFAETAFRRPLAEGESAVLFDRMFATATSPDAAVRRAVLRVLVSPHFLYGDLPPPAGPAGPHAVAARLALALWDSIPDAALADAAAKGELASPEQVAAQAGRLLADPRAREKLRGFFEHWLELDERDLAKDREMFPEFDGAVVADLRRSLLLFVEETVGGADSDWRRLLLADHLLLNARLRPLYAPPAAAAAPGAGEAVPAPGEFRPAAFPGGVRSGVLTHPYLLSAFAYHNNTSPIHRGVFVTRKVIGRSLRPPPKAVAFKDAEFAPDLTMREKITALTREKACMSCHEVINPLGFALENYDAVGRFREAEKGRPVDPSGRLVADDGETVEIRGPRDIAEAAVESPSAHRAFVVQLFHHLVKQNPDAWGPDTAETLRAAFAEDGFHIRNLAARIAALAASRGPAGAAVKEGGGK